MAMGPQTHARGKEKDGISHNPQASTLGLIEQIFLKDLRSTTTATATGDQRAGAQEGGLAAENGR